MGKSFRKTLIIGNAGKHVSEKIEKREANRVIRKHTKNLLKSLDLDDVDSFYDIDKRECSNVWSMNKDGKSYFGDWSNKEEIEKLRRK